MNFHCLLPVWPGTHCLNHLCIKKQQNHLRRFFLPYIPASIPSGPQYSLTSFPQCWHLISRTVHSVSVPSSSKMRRLHLGLGHLITSICHRLPTLIWNKGTRHEVIMSDSLLSFVLYVINLNGLLLQKSQELLPLHVALQIPILVLGLHDIIYNFHPIRLFRKAP